MKALKSVFTPKAFLIAAELMLIFLFTACSSLVLKPTDFSWPVEAVLSVDEDGFVKEERHNIIFDTRELFLEETGDSMSYVNKELRVIRDMKGYIYMTSSNFKNVYIFENGEGELCLSKKAPVSEAGIGSPAFNQRIPYIELIDGNSKYLLTNKGIKEDDNEN
ncbi:MAG: hypothetical protein R6W90_15775 [Ignavibacteriaceae bacterium]